MKNGRAAFVGDHASLPINLVERAFVVHDTFLDHTGFAAAGSLRREAEALEAAGMSPEMVIAFLCSVAEYEVFAAGRDPRIVSLTRGALKLLLQMAGPYAS